MSFTSKVLTTAAFVVLLVGIGAVDAFLTQNVNKLPGEQTEATDAPAPPAQPGNVNGPGVAKQRGPDVYDILNAQGIVTETTREQSLLRRVIPDQVAVDARVVLKDNDRLAFFSWVESADVKTYFSALKEALQESFSPDIADLVDETQEREGKPVRSVLSFTDPAIHEDRLLFIRTRQRLYEFHVAPGKEEPIQVLMDALTE